jgi:hypothetical protein
MKPSIPPSYIFSYWIFAWAAIYILSIWAFQFSKTNPPKWIEWFNPTLVLLIAFIWTTESLIRFFVNGYSWSIIGKYAASIIAIKAIPLWLLYRLGLPFGWNIHTFRDIAVILVMFMIYSIYLWINGTNYEEAYDDLTDSIENDENRTPFEGIVNGVFGI